jgi:hypothetical protein
LTEKKKLKAHYILKHISFHHDSSFPTTIPFFILVHAWLLLQDHSIQYIIRSSANNNDLRVKLAWPLTWAKLNIWPCERKGCRCVK